VLRENRRAENLDDRSVAPRELPELLDRRTQFVVEALAGPIEKLDGDRTVVEQPRIGHPWYPTTHTV
jgi:hypothetical protein